MSDVKPCVCGNAPAHTCAWRMKMQFVVFARSLRPGDVLQVGLVFSRIRRIDPHTVRGFILHTDIGELWAEPMTPVMISTVSPCESPTCEFCERETGPDRYICRSHWDAWDMPNAVDQREEIYNCG